MKKSKQLMLLVLLISISWVSISCSNNTPPENFRDNEDILQTGLYEVNESDNKSCKSYGIIEMGKETNICIIPKLFIGINYIEKAEIVSVKYEGISEKERQFRIEFNDAGKSKFAEFTKKNLGRRIGLIVNDRLVSAPFVQEKISGGNMVASEKYKHTKMSISELKQIVEYEISKLK